jgi:MFS superfamily sulfate permease-like transporter
MWVSQAHPKTARDFEEHIRLTGSLSLMVGLLQVASGFVKFPKKLSNITKNRKRLLSGLVRGFVVGSCLILMARQLSASLGIVLPPTAATGTFAILKYTWSALERSDEFPFMILVAGFMALVVLSPLLSTLFFFFFSHSTRFSQPNYMARS